MKQAVLAPLGAGFTAGALITSPLERKLGFRSKSPHTQMGSPMRASGETVHTVTLRRPIGRILRSREAENENRFAVGANMRAPAGAVPKHSVDRCSHIALWHRP